MTVILACSVVTAAWADGWKLSGTTVYGAGGYWENGQKTRVDCSYKKGQFQYERKVSSGAKMSVYSTKAVFSEPEQSYQHHHERGIVQSSCGWQRNGCGTR